MTPLDKYNTFGKRFLAGIIDGIVFLPFSLLSNRFESAADRTIFIILSFSYTICWTLYLVIGHGRFGQTIGKRHMGIKVLDIAEQNVIGFKRAFYREAVWFFVQTLGLIYCAVAAYSTATNTDLINIYFDDYVRSTISIWFLLELVTMFFNNKRRALHDYMANSVVVDLNEMKREDLQKRHEQLLVSIEGK